MLGVLTGLEQEAVIARNIVGANVACAGARPQQARWLSRDLIKKGVKRLISFGIAGGLEPGLPIGAVVIGDRTSSLDGTWPCDPEWVRGLMRQLPEAHCGGVWGSEILVASARDKRTLYEKSRCMIVDMESQCAAQVAAEAQIPFVVVRAVCDASDMDVPQIVMAAIAEDGSINYIKAFTHILRHPTQIPDLFHVGQGTNRALKMLERIVPALNSVS
jgi:hopanoid-associated phosphorylase